MHKQDELICINMLEAINKIFDIRGQYQSIEDFTKDYISFDATLMNFIVIGEMAFKLSDRFKEGFHQIEWRKISDLRNIIAHDYFGIDEKEIWQIINNKLPDLKSFLEKALNN